MKPYGQGYKYMTPALETFERLLLNGEIIHNNHPVMNMCATTNA
jgi:phage terminase large subunit-like protein